MKENKKKNIYNESNYIKDESSFEKKTNHKKLNQSQSSGAIQIMSLIKSYSTSGSSSFLLEHKKNKNSNHKNSRNLIQKDYSQNEIKAICLEIFMYYAKPINGQFFLSKRDTLKILKEIEIIHENCLSEFDIEIIFQQINKKGEKLSSDQFLDLLAKICSILDDSFYKNKKESFIKLINIYINPYLSRTNAKNGNGSLNINFKNLILNEFKLDEESFEIMNSIIEGLKIIYMTYFYSSEFSLNKNMTELNEQSFKIFMKFLHDFEIVPYLIKQRLAELYWSIIISINVNELYNNDIFNTFLTDKKNDIGIIYTFKKFFILFPHMSFYYFHSLKSKTPSLKLLFFWKKYTEAKHIKIYQIYIVELLIRNIQLYRLYH
jgi:hypothetical protein